MFADKNVGARKSEKATKEIARFNTPRTTIGTEKKTKKRAYRGDDTGKVQMHTRTRCNRVWPVRCLTYRGNSNWIPSGFANGTSNATESSSLEQLIASGISPSTFLVIRRTPRRHRERRRRVRTIYHPRCGTIIRRVWLDENVSRLEGEICIHVQNGREDASGTKRFAIYLSLIY